MANRPEVKAFTIPVYLHEPLKILAKKERRSMSSWISSVIERKAIKEGILAERPTDSEHEPA